MKEVSFYQLTLGKPYLAYNKYILKNTYVNVSKIKMVIFIHKYRDSIEPIFYVGRDYFIEGLTAELNRECVLNRECILLSLNRKMTFFELTEEEFLMHGITEAL